MQKLLLLCALLLTGFGLTAQPVFVDEFDDGNITPDAAHFTYEEVDGELVITGAGTNGDWDGIWFQLPQAFDLSDDKAKIYIRARASSIGTQLRADLVDTGNNFTNSPAITRTLTDEYMVLEFDYDEAGGNEAFDATQVHAIFIFINPGNGGFTGQIAMDYMAIGEEPEGELMSDIYQDHMDTDSSATNFVNRNDVAGLDVERRATDDGDSTIVTIVGDGTHGQWTPLAYALRPPPEFIQTTVDMTDNPVIYVKVRTSVPGTTFRVDIQDTDNISSTGNAITRVITDEWAVYEYDLTGANQNFVNDACPTADVDPCLVNLEAVKELLIYINGGTGQFAGTIDIDWISFGVNLDGEGPEATLEYADDFDNGRVDWTGPTSGFEVDEVDGNLVITGDGTSGEYGTISYDFNEPTDDQDTARVQRTVNFGADFAQGKLFIRARTLGGSHPLRIDLIDTASLATNQAGLTKLLTPEWTVLTYDFTGNYGDAGYGGAEGCTPEAPCLIDESVVRQIFFYVRPGEGLFDGTIEIDWLSVGQPLEEQEATEPGVVNYADSLNNAGEFFTGAPSGVTYSVSEDGYLTLSGDGTSPTYQQVRYILRDEEGGQGKADVAGSGDILYVRARTLNAESAVLRIDLVDEAGFETTNAGSVNTITGSDFATYEYEYAGRYNDGGYGGTSCAGASAPCPVDAQRITQMVLYPAPDNGGFTGDIEINWFSFGQPISVNVRDFAQLDRLRVFPNPAEDQLGVEYTLAGTSQVSISLFDGIGRRVMLRDLGNRTAGENFEALDLSALPAGSYHLQVNVNGLPTRAQRVIKR